MKTLGKALKPQRGLTLVGMLLTAIVVMLLALGIMRVIPAVLEYFTIKNDVNALVASAEMKNASVAEVRESFSKRAQVDDITAISPSDLEIGKEGGELTIFFSYTKKIPLFGPVSLTIDFQGASKRAGN
jgi:hypothetical protein